MAMIRALYRCGSCGRFLVAKHEEERNDMNDWTTEAYEPWCKNETDHRGEGNYPFAFISAEIV